MSVFVQGHALIIGAGGDLPGTVDDAEALADILAVPGHCAYPPSQVSQLIGSAATRGAVRAGLDRLARVASEATVVIYFSGHGYCVTSAMGSAYFLLAYGYDLADLAGTCISGAEFTSRLCAIRARRLLVLLDCCRAGGIGEPKAPGLMFAKIPLPLEMEAILAEGQGRVIIASSRQDEVSFAGQPYSAFTVALLESLSGQGVDVLDGFVRVSDLVLHAREVVPQRTAGRQHPTVKFHQADNFRVAYYAGGTKEPRPLSFPLDPETAAVPEPSAGVDLRGACVGGSVFDGGITMTSSTFVGRDQNIDIGSQVNVSGPVNISVPQRQAGPTADELFDQGLNALRCKMYTLAVDAFEQAVRAGRIDAETHYYLALATLRGKRPRLLNLATVRAVEGHLRTATELDARCGYAYLLWALVKYDYYVMNRIFVHPPTVPQLLGRSGSVSPDRVREILTHVKSPDNRIWEQLCSLLR